MKLQPSIFSAGSGSTAQVHVQQYIAVLFAVLLGLTAVFSTRVYVGATSADVSKSFTSAGPIPTASLVSLQSSDGSSASVVAANATSSNQLVGVAVNAENSLLAVNPADGKVQVVLSGSAATLVSTLNGEIKTGDYIGVSPITGVGAKAKPGDKVIGTAQSDFNQNSANAQKRQIQVEGSGAQEDVWVGATTVLVAVGVMPGAEGGDGGGPKGIKEWLASIAGQPVSVARIVICGIIAIVALLSLVTMISSAIKNGLTASSRNPLAKPVIFETLAQVMAMVAFVAVISVAIMYAVLRV